MQQSTANTIEFPKDGAIDFNSFKRILDEKLSTSYKIFWFFGIYSEIINGNKEITFRRLICRMIASAWYPVSQFNELGNSFEQVENIEDLFINLSPLKRRTREMEDEVLR